MPWPQAVEIVVQNVRGGANGGEYPSSNPTMANRQGGDQHPFHMHGGHFWLVGMGMGNWTEDSVETYNLENPILRDTATVLFGNNSGEALGWVAFRYIVSNPGAGGPGVRGVV